MSLKTKLSIALSVAFLLLPALAFADVQQPDFSIQDSINRGVTNPYIATDIGAGYSGTVTGGELYLQSDGGMVYNVNISIQVRQYSDAGYTTQIGVCTYDLSSSPSSSPQWYNLDNHDSAYDSGLGCVISSSSYVQVQTNMGIYGLSGWHVISYGSNSVPSGWTVTIAGSGSYSYAVPAFGVYGIGNGIIGNRTQIATVTPASASTIASSTAATFGVTGFVNPSDYIPGMSVTMSYSPYIASQEASALPSSYFTTVSFPITASGSFSFSTSSPALTVGNYTMQTSIVGASSVNFFGLFSFNVPFTQQTYTSTSTTFIVDELNGFDVYMASSTEALQSILNETGTSSQACAIGVTFNVNGCIGYIFIPQPQVLDQQFQQFYNSFLTYAPWGYLTRLIVILSSQGTSSLPSATATVALPYAFGNANDTTDLTIDPTATLAEASSDLNSVDANGTDLNWQQVLEPYVQLFIGFTLLFIIVHDLMGTANHHRRNFK